MSDMVVKMLTAGLIQEMPSTDADIWYPFFETCVMALAKGRVLVGRATGFYGAEAPVIAAFPDGRLTVDGEDVACESPIALPANNAFDVARAWFSLVGWQNGDFIASQSEDCSVCHESGLVLVDTASSGRLAVECGCVDVPWETPLQPRSEEDVAREEDGEWMSGNDICAAKAA